MRFEELIRSRIVGPPTGPVIRIGWQNGVHLNRIYGPRITRWLVYNIFKSMYLYICIYSEPRPFQATAAGE